MDAQQAFASAFRAAAGLLKRFTQPVGQEPAASTSQPPVTPEAQPEAAPEPVTGDRNTLWLDSNELTEVAP